ncbi:uncharacterized protein N7511_010509 [Penicillium nucicola]|uniref:uncharacterized protein n=1 Tax=Penicillium nucicola TaxID=1850975 RepID=UPI0025451A17|nr:uncharacterized protein N7511_010509 [Penicillium nucicola]KAJ5748813.1 hypothetical protein N7511_010509 [Penicillium nucicola]
MTRLPHVGIIGAGLSGLRCADILIQNGAHVTILEARDRIGGRVHQSSVGSHVVDLGPNWIHGAGENPIMDIAKATGAIMYDPEGGIVKFSREGGLIDDAVTSRVENFVWTTISEAFQYSNQHGDSIPAEKSLLDFFNEKVGKSGLPETEKALVLDACKLWGAYVGEPTERQSLRFFRLEECVDGSNFVVASTYKRILEHVSKNATAKADIHLNEPVVNINAPQRDDEPSTPHQVTVKTATGKTYTFDEVVVTCPLGWLKQNITAFNPALPPRLLEAINNISYGRLEKVYVTFPQAWWHIDPTAPQTKSQLQKNTVVAQFLEPTYTPHPPSTEWNQECLSLASLPAGTSHPTLLFYTYGEGGAAIINRISHLDPQSPEYKDILMKTLEPFYSRLPGYDATSGDCLPSAMLATQWQKDEYAGHGSYCNFQVGVAAADRDIEVLRDGGGSGRLRGLWFAGEHTAPFVALGTTTGAYWSGERVAKRVCELRGLEGVGVDIGVGDELPSGAL